MKAAAAAAAALAEVVDLENGGGGGGAGAVVESWPYPVDKRLKEKQPFTWLGAAPYIAVILVGAVLFTGGMVIYSGAPPKTEEGQPYHMTTRDVVGTALIVAGMLVGLLGIFAGAFAADEEGWECNLPPFGPD